jgi:hypothetical protein
MDSICYDDTYKSYSFKHNDKHSVHLNHLFLDNENNWLNLNITTKSTYIEKFKKITSYIKNEYERN